MRRGTADPVQNLGNRVGLIVFVQSGAHQHMHMSRHHYRAVDPCTIAVLSSNMFQNNRTGPRWKEDFCTHGDKDGLPAILEMWEIATVFVTPRIVNGHRQKIQAERSGRGELSHKRLCPLGASGLHQIKGERIKGTRFARSRASGLHYNRAGSIK